jgi:dienelactone hydrolase
VAAVTGHSHPASRPGGSITNRTPADSHLAVAPAWRRRSGITGPELPTAALDGAIRENGVNPAASMLQRSAKNGFLLRIGGEAKNDRQFPSLIGVRTVIDQTVGSAWRRFARFFSFGWRECAFACVAATLALCGWEGYYFETGLGRPLDVMLCIVAGAIGIGITGLALLALRRILCAWPSRFVFWCLGAVVFGIAFYASRGTPILLAAVLLGSVFVLLGAAGFGLGVALRREHPRFYRTVGWGVTLGVAMATCALLWWLASPGVDPYVATRAITDAAATEPLLLADPGAPGPFHVRTLSYGSGTDLRRPEYARGVAFRTPSVDASILLKGFTGLKAALRKRYWGFGKEAFPLNGRVWYPDGPGRFPLVLCVHGNHTAQAFSDPGYQYLGEHLASRGFIFVSVDENFLNYSWEGDMSDENATRGWMLLKHLEAWRGWNQQAGHPFAGHVDLNRIALIGHSRGGEAVLHAAALNRLSRWPEDARLAFDFGFRIRSVVAIAPVDGAYEVSGAPTPIRDVDYLLLHGSHDSDVYVFGGERAFRRLAFTDGQPHFKAMFYLYRANHGQFNTSWGDNDIDDTQSALLAKGGLLPADTQRRVARVAISAFLEASLNGDRGYHEFMRDPRRGAAWLQDFLVGDRLISLVGDHLTGSLAEPKATILTRRSSCWQVFVL